MCIASYFRANLPLKHSEWHLLMGDHTVLPATHTFIHKWNEPSCLYSPAAAHQHFGRCSFPVPRRVGGWVGLRGCLHTEVVCQPEDGHRVTQYQPTDSAAQARRPKHRLAHLSKGRINNLSSIFGGRNTTGKGLKHVWWVTFVRCW